MGRVAEAPRSHKCRRDYIIADDTLIKQTQALFDRRIVPQFLNAHQFRAT